MNPHASRVPHTRFPLRPFRGIAIPMLTLALLAAALGTHARAGAPAAARQPGSKLSILDEARSLQAQTCTHVSYATFLSSLTARLRIAGATSPQIRLNALDEADALAEKTASYRNAAVAAQQGLEVVIEKSSQWSEPKLRMLLDGAREMLAGAESLRAEVAPGIIARVLGEDSPPVLGEITSGRWSGFEDPIAPADPDNRAPTPDERK